MKDLFAGDRQPDSGPVECLGQTFPSEQACREHFSKLLAEKLKDPAFRKSGFPEGGRPPRRPRTNPSGHGPPRRTTPPARTPSSRIS